jgi:hypothetical protein
MNDGQLRMPKKRAKSVDSMPKAFANEAIAADLFMRQRRQFQKMLHILKTLLSWKS